MPHRVALADGWSVWRWACLRSAGLPAAEVLRLQAPEELALADRAAGAAAAVKEARAGAVQALQRALSAEEPGGAARAELAKALRIVRAGVPVARPRAAGAEAHDALAAFEGAVQAARRERQALAEALERWHDRTGAVLRELAGGPLLREALLWQNRHAWHTGLLPLLRSQDGRRNSSLRQKERMLASYLQRYCVKNDTIGFFGPVGWASLGRAAEPVRLRVGPGLLARRTVYFEHWAIDALAGRLAADPELRALLPPRRSPVVRLEGDVLHYPVGRQAELDEPHRSLLRACDGRTRAADLVEGQRARLGASAAELWEALEELAERKLILWTLEIPTAGHRPEQALAAQLQALGEGAPVGRARAALASLEAARSGAGAAAGDPEAVDRALGALEATFRAVTGGAQPTRREGATYAGRTLAYEDCVRDVELELGAAVLERLGPPLALVLHSARWLTRTLADRFRALCRELHQRLARESGHPAVDFIAFRQALVEHFPEPGGSAPSTREALARLQAGWAELLGLGRGGARIEARAEALRPEVLRRFPAARPGWPSARHHSPDVMIAARDVEAIRAGDCLLVLGELHAGLNTVAIPLFAKEHPHPEALERALAADLPAPSVWPVVSRARTGRADFFSLSPHHLDLELGPSRSRRPRGQVLQAAELVVEERGGALRVRERDGARDFDVVAFFEQLLTAETVGSFSLLPPAPHTPRVTVDGVVLCREQWRFAPGQLPFAETDGPDGQLLAARAWAREHGLPRFLFVKVPEEPKPCYVDLASPLYVDLLAKLARKASRLSVSEMLPGLDQLWLPDAEGRRYCCELRIAAVDPESWE